MSKYVPERGHVVWLNFDPQAGHEQSGKRPALVISPVIYNKRTGLVLLCPITKQIKGYPFEVLIPEAAGTKGVILSDQVKNVDYIARKARFIEELPVETTEEVLGQIATLIE